MPDPDLKKAAEDSITVLPLQKAWIISEDWLAVILAFLLIILSAIGLLGPHGIRISF